MSGATVKFNAAVGRWFVYDARGRAVAWRKSEAEANEVAAALPGEPAPRVRPERKMLVSEVPVTHKELRGSWPPVGRPTVHQAYARSKRMTRRR